MPINTAKSPRRPLRFESIPQALAEARRLAALDDQGQTTCTGNWTLGQILNHLAAWAEMAYTGTGLKPAWYMRPIFRLAKGYVLKKGLPAGKGIPGVEGGTLATEPATTHDGLARLERAFTRIQNDPPPDRHPLFGKFTHANWIALHLRHAELHLSFVK